jgi:spoIIIJ-associated protein
MSISREFTAKTTEEAIENGLKEMGVSASDVQIETLQEGAKGLFGLFGSRPARVRITLREETTDAKDLVHALFEEKKPTEKKPQEKKPVTEEPAAPEITAEAEKKEAPKAEEKPAQEKPAAEKKKPAPEKNEQPKQPREKAAKEKPAKEKAPKERPPRKENKGGDAKKKAEPKVIVPTEQLDRSTQAGEAQEFLQQLTKLMGVEVSVAVTTDEDGSIRVNMEGDTLGILIGRRGETLDALQYLTSLKVNRGHNDYTRVTLDTEHYRAKREEALTRLANRMANRAQKTGRKVNMEPMNPYERRILHSALQGNEAVTTHSEGEEPNRHVVIVPVKKSAKPAEAPAKEPEAAEDEA